MNLDHLKEWINKFQTTRQHTHTPNNKVFKLSSWILRHQSILFNNLLLFDEDKSLVYLCCCFWTWNYWIKCVQALKNPNPLSLMEDLMCLLLLRCFRIGSGVDYLCKSTLDWIQSLSILKPFELKVFFKLSEKQPVVLSKQPIVLYLGVFEKGWKLFLMVDL